MTQNDQTGIFFIGVQNSGQVKKFPKEFKRGLLSRFEPQFLLILAICSTVLFTVVAILASRKPPDTISDQEVSRIQERYARLVLNQPKPVIDEGIKEIKDPQRDQVVKKVEEEKQEVVEIDREKETFVEKKARREASTEERLKKRDEVAKQIQSSGIFAAITAAGGTGTSRLIASDLLGKASDGIADLSSIEISKGTFATKNVDPAELTQRKGERTTGVGIEKQEVRTTAVAQVASTATVNITSQPPEVTGESAGHADRSQAAIQRVVNREAQRLRRVYEDWLKRDPQLSGRLTVKFVILPHGAVSNISIVRSTMNNQEFDDAIIRYIRRWQFQAVPGGAPVEVVYPFVFEGHTN